MVEQHLQPLQGKSNKTEGGIAQLSKFKPTNLIDMKLEPTDRKIREKICTII